MERYSGSDTQLGSALVDGISAGCWLQVRSMTASGEIVAQIRERLFSGAFKPGDFLGTERGLCAEFGVARLTMRDALRILEANGVVEVKVGKGGGVRVAQPNAGRVAEMLAIQLRLEGISHREIFDAQMGVEMRAVQLAAERRDPVSLKALERQLETVCAAAPDADGFVSASLEFHLCAVRASGNRALIAQFQALRRLSQAAIEPTHSPQRARQVIAKHAKLLAAISKGDGAGAAGVVAEHIGDVINATIAKERAKELAKELAKEQPAAGAKAARTGGRL